MARMTRLLVAEIIRHPSPPIHPPIPCAVTRPRSARDGTRQPASSSGAIRRTRRMLAVAAKSVGTVAAAASAYNPYPAASIPTSSATFSAADAMPSVPMNVTSCRPMSTA